MKIDHPPVNSWTQLALFPGDVYEVTLRLGVVSSSRHMQVMLDVRNPSTGELLSMESLPHADLADSDEVLQKWARKFLAAAFEISGPF